MRNSFDWEAIEMIGASNQKSNSDVLLRLCQMQRTTVV